MQIQIEVIAVDDVNKGKYNVAEVTFKQDGKTKDKKVMSFGSQASAYAKIKTAKKGEVYNVEITKNDNGYWDWIDVQPSSAGGDSGSVPNKGNAAPARGNYETPEERFQRQVYIIRQSSLTNAIAHLNHVKKAYDVTEILTTARTFEEFVFGKSVAKKDTSAAAVPSETSSLAEMEDDVPM